MAFNAKNLAYENKQPAFLQKLRNQYGDTSGRLERPAPRPRLAKKDDVDDDEPTYVDEESNEVISKEEYEALLRGDEKQQESSEQRSGGQEQDTEKPDVEGSSSKQNLAGIRGPKKRKQAKVIADDSVEAESGTPKQDTGPQKAKQKQKKKKIKLSFDE